MQTESERHLTFGEMDTELVSQINKLATQVQQQRANPLMDKEAQRKALRKLENDLSACWMQRRELRVRTHYQPLAPTDVAPSG